jgi:hypothetical protein
MMKQWQISGITFLYFILCVIGIIYHELWLDEAHHILLAKQSNSVSELIYNSRYEGHPRLWNLLLYLIMHVFDNYIYVQLFHILISSSCVYLILKHAPFNLLVKLCIVFGYFMIYEYSVISRNYGLSLLFILLSLISISKEKRNLILIASVLAILCNTHLFSLFLAVSFVPILWSTWVKSDNKTKWISLVILATGVFVAAIQIITPQDHFWHEFNEDGFFSIKRVYKAGWVPLRGLLPMPNFSIRNYWNSNLLFDYCKPIAAIVSVLLFVTPLFLFRKNKASALVFYITSLGVMYLTPLMFTARNCGFLSMALFAAMWLSKSNTIELPDKGVIKVSKIYFSIILIGQLIGGLMAYSLDFKRDFSNSKKTADYLNHHFVNDSIPILLTHHTSGPALALHSKRKIFYLESNKYGNFCEWNTFPFHPKDSVLLQRIYTQLQNKDKCILITNQKRRMGSLDSLNSKINIIPNLQVTKIAEFTGATITSENYLIYTLSH